MSAQTLTRHGAVSRETVLEMATGALLRSQVQLSVAVSGVAGPGGGTPDKPVGTVWLAWATQDSAVASHRVFSGDRTQVRRAAVDAALRGLLERAR
mgnify:FL=1